MICANCDRRDTCTELCPLAKEYANQDWHDFNPHLVSLYPRMDIAVEESENLWDFTYGLQTNGLLEKTATVLSMYNSGYSLTEISETTGRTYKAVKDVLARARAKNESKVIKVERVVLRKGQ